MHLPTLREECLVGAMQTSAAVITTGRTSAKDAQWVVLFFHYYRYAWCDGYTWVADGVLYLRVHTQKGKLTCTCHSYLFLILELLFLLCCSTFRYREDVALMKGMGLKYYRLSISWARIFPNGKGKVNDRGVAFYDRLINELIANKIMPVVTLYHWDLPLGLQLEEDGWLNPKIVDHFVKFAKLCFTR